MMLSSNTVAYTGERGGGGGGRQAGRQADLH